MKKEMGKWLMDIAKYLATAVLISAFFRDIQEKSTIILFGLSAIVLSLSAGVYLVKDPKKKVKRKK